ncbi:MAG TPA: sigma 54-interacting transcriptional regulator [Kofleriaceae bacterium]|nr:sigma 54-interacting transcriptional regulator [Kofleriaceae bacterium]
MQGAGVRFSGGFTDGADTLPGRDQWLPVLDGGRAGAARLFVSLERHRLTAGGRRLVLEDLDEVIVARGRAGRIERTGRVAVVLVGDFETSRRHLAIRRIASAWVVEDLGSRNGTLVNGERVERAELADGDYLEAGGAVLQFATHGELGRDEHDCDLEDAAAGPSVFQTLNLALEERIEQIRRIAPSRVPVLVHGETGTGKELMARAVHEASGRPGEFVAVNCGALPRGLIESELFGHRRGAFSGADEDREGLCRRAHRGTLFLDEIAELAAESQSALLRVLQEGEVRPVGASESVKVDVRIVAASHQDLAQRIGDGRFRQDLYGRIAGFEITMPALRDRREDLGTLIATILPRISASPERFTLHRDAACALLRYPWPQNIRELEQALSAAVALCDDGKLRLAHLPEAVASYRPHASAALTGDDAELRVRLVGLLESSSGNVAAVARAMARAPVQIRRWCRRLHIDLAKFRH